MTEKRYSKMMNHYGTSRTYCTGIYDNQNNRELQNSNQVITELNALHEEKRELQMRYDAQREVYIQLVSDYNNLHEENEQCKLMIATLRNIILENGIDVE